MAIYMKDYPRPQFVRSAWQSLNGLWQFAFDDSDAGIKNRWMDAFPAERTICVPFTYETAMSGIGDEHVHRIVWYSRQLPLQEPVRDGERLLLHFEGSDYRTEVWCGGVYLGAHRGGYSRFTFDLTDALRYGAQPVLTVRVADSFAQNQPRGKQRYRGESWGCWYVQTTGIWKTVWLERVPQQYIRSVVNTPDARTGQLLLQVETAIPEERFAAACYELEIAVFFDGDETACSRAVLKSPLQNVAADIREDGQKTLRLWSPDTPNLYDVRYRLYCDGELLDTVDSYFGLRSIDIRGDRIFLNDEELYLRMILDQGYWKDSGLTPPSEAALQRDIELTLEFGYNGARKHQKVEDERYLYWCDVRGLLVWSEMAATYAFDSCAVEQFTDEWGSVVRQNQNHPAIIAWVPFNESWGVPEVRSNLKQQAFVNSIYYLTKSLDGTRPVITNDGWEHTISDILTIHDYKEVGAELLDAYADEEKRVLNNQRSVSWYGQLAFAQGYAYRGQPVVLSEYGGIAFRSESGWGYGGQVKDEAEFLQRFESQNDAIHRVPYFTGFCYTQLTDVQQEVNGLVDMQRQEKFSPMISRKIREINRRIGRK